MVRLRHEDVVLSQPVCILPHPLHQAEWPVQHHVALRNWDHISPQAALQEQVNLGRHPDKKCGMLSRNATTSSKNPRIRSRTPSGTSGGSGSTTAVGISPMRPSALPLRKQENSMPFRFRFVPSTLLFLFARTVKLCRCDMHTHCTQNDNKLQQLQGLGAAF